MRIACCTLAWVFALFFIEPADAKSARTFGMSAMRASPGWTYEIIAVVPRGTLVNARYCISNGWCRVEWRGKRGWIEGKSLRTRDIKRRAARQ